MYASHRTGNQPLELDIRGPHESAPASDDNEVTVYFDKYMRFGLTLSFREVRKLHAELSEVMSRNEIAPEWPYDLDVARTDA